MHEAAPRTAVVADPRPFERDFVRFLLEEEGFVVRAEVGAVSDLLLALQREMPAAVILNERLAHGHDDAVIQQVRWLAPQARIVVVTAGLATTPTALGEIADETILDGVGLMGLGVALAGPRPALAPVPILAAPTDPTDVAESSAAAPPQTPRRWAERLQGAVAASVIALAVIVLQDGGTILRSSGDDAAPTVPSVDVGPLAPDRPSGDPTGNEGGTEEAAVPLALALPSLLIGPVEPEAEPSGTPAEAPAPAEAPSPTPPPAETPSPAETTSPARPGVAGPPREVASRLKPMVQELVSRLPARGEGAAQEPRPGLGPRGGPPLADGSSGSTGSDGHGSRPPWAGPPATRGKDGAPAGFGPPVWVPGPRR